MPSKPKSLRVLVNPYSSVDHNGDPSGSLLADPVGHIKYRDARQGDASLEATERFDQRVYVGARVVRGATIREADFVDTVNGRILIAAEYEHTWDFEKEVITVPYTLYYHRAINDGHLFAADEKTWRAIGNRRNTFVDPKDLLAWAKEGAIAAHLAHHSDPEEPESDHEDERLQRLATHWDDHVEQRHPTGAKAAAHFHAARADELARAAASDPAKKDDADHAAKRAERALGIYVAHLERAAKYHGDRAEEFADPKHPHFGLAEEAAALAKAAGKALADAKPARASSPTSPTTTEH